MSHAFSREDFLRSLDPFYVAIERTAATIDDFSQKQGFLNTVYEQFFQGFSVGGCGTRMGLSIRRNRLLISW